MPLFLLRKLGLVEARPTTVSLQLVDRFIKYLRGMIGDVLVKYTSSTYQQISSSSTWRKTGKYPLSYVELP